jgi:hypothetical protein
VTESGLQLVDGHLIAVTDGRFLLDTGSPLSFSRTGRATWGGQDHALPTGALGLDADELSDLVGEPLDGLIGGDLLGLHPFTIDLERSVCAVGAPVAGRPTTELSITLVLGVPVATLELDGVPTTTCIDTGAKLSYLEAVRLEGREAVDQADDFYPGFGPFRTPVYGITARIADSELSIRVGSLPDELSGMLAMLGIAAILGTDVFEHFPVVTFDYPAARITLGQGWNGRKRAHEAGDRRASSQPRKTPAFALSPGPGRSLGHNDEVALGACPETHRFSLASSFPHSPPLTAPDTRPRTKKRWPKT